MLSKPRNQPRPIVAQQYSSNRITSEFFWLAMLEIKRLWTYPTNCRQRAVDANFLDNELKKTVGKGETCSATAAMTNHPSTHNQKEREREKGDRERGIVPTNRMNERSGRVRAQKYNPIRPRKNLVQTTHTHTHIHSTPTPTPTHTHKGSFIFCSFSLRKKWERKVTVYFDGQ